MQTMTAIVNWLTANKDAIGGVSALAGIIGGPFLSFLKTAIGRLNDRSWKRKTAECAAEIAHNIKDLQEAEMGVGAIDSQLLAPYREHLRKRIIDALDQIRKDDERLIENAKRQLEMPKGIRKWLLIFRPNGVAGWLLHTAFYAWSIWWVVMLAMCIVDTLLPDRGELNWAYALTFSAIAGSVVFPLQSAALKRRQLNLSLRGKSSPQCDLPRWRRMLLLFRAADTVSSFERAAVYFWLFICPEFVLLFSAPPDVRLSGLQEMSLMIWQLAISALLISALAIPSWYDMLLRRRLADDKAARSQANTLGPVKS